MKLDSQFENLSPLNSREFLGIRDERVPLSAEVPFFVPKPQGASYRRPLLFLIIGNGPPFSLKEAGLLNFNNFGENQHENDP